jgi:hypothetical protein
VTKSSSKNELLEIFRKFGYLQDGKDCEIKIRTTSGSIAWININSIETIKKVLTGYFKPEQVIKARLINSSFYPIGYFYWKAFVCRRIQAVKAEIRMEATE